MKFGDAVYFQSSQVSNFDFTCHLTLKNCTSDCEKNSYFTLCTILEDSYRKFLVLWKISLFYFAAIFWPTEINLRNYLLNLDIKIKICRRRLWIVPSPYFKLNYAPIHYLTLLYRFQVENPIEIIMILLMIKQFYSINCFIVPQPLT